MAYSTQSDLEKQLPKELLVQLTDDDGDGVIDSGIVPDAIQKADDEINAYAATRYTVPFAPVPPLVRALSVDLAIWGLYARRGRENETVTKRYDRAVQLLRDLAAGKASLGETPGPAESETGLPESTTTVSDERIFTKDTMGSY